MLEDLIDITESKEDESLRQTIDLNDIGRSVVYTYTDFGTEEKNNKIRQKISLGPVYSKIKDLKENCPEYRIAEKLLGLSDEVYQIGDVISNLPQNHEYFRTAVLRGEHLNIPASEGYFVTRIKWISVHRKDKMVGR